MFSHWQKRQLWVIETGFFYLPNFPLLINRHNKILERCPTKRQTANKSFVVMTGINLMTAILILIVGWSQMSKLTTIKDIDVSYLILMIFAIPVLMVTVAVSIIYKDKIALLGLNELNSVNTQLQADFNRPQCATKLLEAVTCYFVTSLLLAPPVFLLVSLVTQKDPYFQLIESVFGESSLSTIEKISKIFLINLVRPLLLSCFSELARTFCYLTYEVVKLWCTLVSILSVMLYPEFYRCSTYIKYFQFTAIAVKYLKQCAEDLLSFGLSFIFWTIVFALWILIKLSLYIPYFINIWLLLCVLSGLAAICVAILNIAGINDTWKTIVEKQRYTKKIKYIMSKSGKDKHNARIEWKIALALQPTNFAYAPFLPIDKEFCVDYLKTLVERVVDALMIF